MRLELLNKWRLVMKNLEIVYPDPCIPAEKVCPYGHKDNIVPIVYGMPGAETMKMAEQGLVHLAGCVVSDCDPRWYCKAHETSHETKSHRSMIISWRVPYGQ